MASIFGKKISFSSDTYRSDRCNLIIKIVEDYHAFCRNVKVFTY
jgi:hypothetical protein